MLKEWFSGYIRRNRKELLAFDYRAAGWVGAPEGYTLSAYAHDAANRGHLWGKVWQRVIDRLFLWLFDQVGHCRMAYEADAARIRRRLVG